MKQGMDWKEALTALIETAPKLAFKQELVDALKGHLKSNSPPTLLVSQVDVMLAISKQNQRLADLYGYANLEAQAKKLEVCCTNLLSALKSAGAPANAKPVNV
jgi:hypothetical protein